jgi:hypothetical protein
MAFHHPYLNMKSFLLRVCTLFTLIAPLAVADARAPKPPVIVGGFEAGKTFTFTVSTRIASGTVGGQVINPAPIPKGVPNLTVGQQVTFTIGKKGELRGPQMNFPFSSDGGTTNVYLGKIKGVGNVASAQVGKNLTTGEPTGVALYFVINKFSRKTGPSSTQIAYTLNP